MIHIAIFAIHNQKDTFSDLLVLCFQLYGRHKECLSGLVGSEFEMVSTRGPRQGPGALLPVEPAAWLAWLPPAPVSKACFARGVCWQPAPHGFQQNIGQKGGVAMDAGPAEVRPASVGAAAERAERRSLCETACIL